MKLRALLELCRISNLPTVWSNCVLGYFAGVVVDSMIRQSDHPEIQRFAWDDVLLMLLRMPIMLILVLLATLIPISLLYCGGMALNDCLDRKVDAVERPARPIPSGRISVRAAWLVSIALLFTGFLGLVSYGYFMGWQRDSYLYTGTFALLLVSAIVAYNALHLRGTYAVFLMGSCRALIVLTIAAAVVLPTATLVWWLFIAGPAVTLLIYTVLISIVARHEVEQGSAAKPRRFMLLPRSFGGPKTVMNMIAAMPLLDAAWLVVMGLWPASLFCVACAGMTKLAHRGIAGS